jgi:hypothetical protein
MLGEKGQERERFDNKISAYIGEKDRANIWSAVDAIFATVHKGGPTLALGRVQSGKTTSIAALSAAAADKEYQIIIAFLGSTNLLLDQNRDRLEAALEMDSSRYVWKPLPKITGKSSAPEIMKWVDKGRCVFIPVIKNAQPLRKLAAALDALPDAHKMKVLIVDDEADQASLNTRINDDSPSSTYSAITEIREAVPQSLYVQYTATPYAPLLLPPGDPLSPTSIVFLEPGDGYTGGREFFVLNEQKVTQVIPDSDEENSIQRAGRLPFSLKEAFAFFVAGAAVLYSVEKDSPPISMLVHSTHLKDGQRRYAHLLNTQIDKLISIEDLKDSESGELLSKQRLMLEGNGVSRIDNDVFWGNVDLVLRELNVELVNSASDVKSVEWNHSPFHLLVGGNKLDRGFTVEGLTVTYMNRKPSEQVDTIEQRARAFGYRSSFLPYCRVYATERTIELLKGIVHTEDDLRAELEDWVESGGEISDWAYEIGLNLPQGARPTRTNVIHAVQTFNAKKGWFWLRRPDIRAESIKANKVVVEESGLLTAPFTHFGRLSFRTIHMTIPEMCAKILNRWSDDGLSPNWPFADIMDYLERFPEQNLEFPVYLMAMPDGELQPRTRAWSSDLGFANIFQGRDVKGKTSDRYEGDQSVGVEEGKKAAVALQLHYVQGRDGQPSPLFTPAIQLANRQISRKGATQ